MKIGSKVSNRNQKINPIIIILISAITLISLRWLIIYFSYPSEPLINKIIFDLKDYVYFPYIINLSNLNFSPDYLTNHITNKIITFPIYSLMFHSLIYSIFTEYSFIIAEFFIFFLFLYIFFKIFRELNINTYFAIIFALGVFLLPELLAYFKHIKIGLINFNILNSLYSFQIPRPFVSGIYFFWGLLLAIYYYKYRNKNYFFILIGINLALNFGSVYYNFVILSVLFLVLFFINLFKNNKDFFLYSLKKNLLVLITFLSFSLPFFIMLFFSEKDFWLRAGTFDPSIYQKKILLNHIFFKLLSFKFLSFFFVITSCLFILLRKQNFFCKKTITVIYLLFFSSCISPLIFILFSPTVSEIYHFVDLIVVIAILVLFIFVILIFATFSINKNKISRYCNFILKSNFCFLLLIVFISIIYNCNYFFSYKKNSNLDFRNDINILHNYLNQNNNYEKINNLLTFNNRVQTWWLFLGKRNFSTIHSIFTPLKTHEHELNFIDNLKFLNISEKNFNNIISNKKEGWRYNNRYVRYFSSYTYQANSLITYNNSKNFENAVLKFIKNSSPLFTQQLALPQEEIKRLMYLFNNSTKLNFEEPDIIIFEKNSLIAKYSNISVNNYCKLKKLKYLDIYLNLKKTFCDL